MTQILAFWVLILSLFSVSAAFPLYAQEQSPPQVYVIGVGGGTASGKSTLARRLVELLGPDLAVFFSQDLYFDPSLQPPELAINGGPNFDHPSAMNFPLMLEHLKALLAGQSIVAPSYDYESAMRSTTVTHPVAARPIIVVEGIHALHDPAMRALMDHKVFVYLDADLRLVRRIRRDLAERSVPVERQLQWWTSMVKPMHDQFIEPTRAFADSQVHGDHTEEGAQALAALARQWIAARCAANLGGSVAAAETP